MKKNKKKQNEKIILNHEELMPTIIGSLNTKENGPIVVLGILIFFGYLVFNFVKLIVLLFKKNLRMRDEQVLVGWTIGTMSILASSITNPYIAGLSVFFVLVMEVYLIQLYDLKY